MALNTRQAQQLKGHARIYVAPVILPLYVLDVTHHSRFLTG